MAATSTSSSNGAPTGSILGIDTSVLLPAFERTNDRTERAFELLESVRTGRVHALISTIAAAELLVGPIRQGWTDRLISIQAFLLKLPNVSLLAPTWSVAFEAARIRATHGIQLPDALIVASALQCDAFASADKRALTVARAEGIEVMAI